MKPGAARWSSSRPSKSDPWSTKTRFPRRSKCRRFGRTSGSWVVQARCGMNRETRRSSLSLSRAGPPTCRPRWSACSCRQSMGAAENGLLRNVTTVERGGDASFIEDDYSIRQPDHLGELRRHEQDGGPVRRQLRDEPVDLLFGADVNADSGVVENDELRSAYQPATKDHFLLVAARQG